MKQIITTIIISVIFSFGCVSTVSAASNGDIKKELIGIIYDVAQKVGLNDLERRKTEIIHFEIKDMGNGQYRAMADIRLFSKQWGEYHAVSFKQYMISGNSEMHALGNYTHNVDMDIYAEAKMKFERYFVDHNFLVIK